MKDSGRRIRERRHMFGWSCGRSEALKRVMDVLIAGAAAFLLLPLLAGVAVTVLVSMGRPVLFTQERTGLGGRPFRLVKFRTMTDERGAAGALLPDHLRLTRVGRFLRTTSLDELPELWNVLKGDMSLVGPRPLLTEYLPLYSPEQVRRHEVRPGITGLAQVEGRNRLGWDDRFHLDVWYVNHRSLALDIRILFRTITPVVARRGITQEGMATASKFRGSR